MATSSNRTINSNIRNSQNFLSLDIWQRDLFQGMIAVADDQGRLPGSAAMVRSKIWPSDDVTLDFVQKNIDALANHTDPFIFVYTVNGISYIQIINWWKWQPGQWYGPSPIPAPDGWRDRCRYHGKGDKIITLNWTGQGGFVTENTSPILIQDSGLDRHLDSGLSCPSGDGETEGESETDGDGVGDDFPAAGKQERVDAALLTSPQQIKIWNSALGVIQQEMPKAEFDAYIRPLKLGSMDGNQLKVLAMNTPVRDWVRKRAGPQLQNALKGFAGCEINLLIESDVQEMERTKT